MIELPELHGRPGPTAPWWERRASWIYDCLLGNLLPDHSETGISYPLEHVLLGTLHLPGGELAAGDPYVMGAEPLIFSRRLGADVVEVVATVAGDERMATLLLLAGSNPVCGWAMATSADDDVCDLAAEDYRGYPVDSGTGALGSPAAMRRVGQALADDAGRMRDPLSATIHAQMGTCSAMIASPDEGLVAVAICSSGWGDGDYPTWLGLDDTGAVMVALTDFLLTSDPYQTIEHEDVMLVSWWRRLLGR